MAIQKVDFRIYWNAIKQIKKMDSFNYLTVDLVSQQRLSFQYDINNN
jgi:hypothetical protein